MKRRLLLVVLMALSACHTLKGHHGHHTKKTPTIGERTPVLALENKLEADPSIADTPVTLPPSNPNADWAQPGVSADKAPGNLSLPADLTEVWVSSIGAGSTSTRRLASGPVVSGGRVFTVDALANVAAFDMKTGDEIWRRTIARERAPKALAFGGGVSADATHVYATSGYGVVMAFAPGDGKPLWRTDVGAPLRGAPAVSEDRIFVISQDNQIFALNATTGKQVWDVSGTIEQAGLLGVATPAIAGGTVVAGFSSGELTAFLSANGRTVWQDALARTGRSTAIASLADIDASPVIDRDRVFAIGHGGRMVALELTTGQRVWERGFAGLSQPWVAGDWVFALTLKNELVALSRADGKVRWVKVLPEYRKAKKKVGDIRWYGPVLASDKLWVTGSHGRVGWVNPSTGNLGDTWPLPGPTYLPPVIAGDMLFALTDRGQLVAFRGTAPAPAPIAAPTP